VVLGERHVPDGFETSEDFSRQPGDVGPGQVERQKSVADSDKRLRTDALAEVVSLEVQLHHLHELKPFSCSLAVRAEFCGNYPDEFSNLY